MKIDISTIDCKRFHINERIIPGLGEFVLVVPYKAMWAWQESELHLRSLLSRPDGNVVSSGFGKFFNFGETPSSDNIVMTGMREGRTRFTEKVDGTLIIRSVIDGRVHFRTRGCEVIASNMRETVERLIRDNYPGLLSPEYGRANSSLLLEYIGPENQIVVRYEKPELVCLGWVDFSGPELAFYPDCPQFAQARSVKLYDLGAANPDTLRSLVQQFPAEEGIVTWTTTPAGSTHLCKFKSSWYLRLHALRSQATPRYLNEFCYFNSIASLDQLKEAFYRNGFDWEIVSYIEPLYNELETHVKHVEKVQKEVDQSLQDMNIYAMPTRKDKALAARTLAEDLRQRGSGEWFGYIMSKSVGEDTAEHIGAMKLGMGLTQFRQFIKSGPEPLGSGESFDEG
jgi:hypothetical protein